jgi:hypothetical protein
MPMLLLMPIDDRYADGGLLHPIRGRVAMPPIRSEASAAE